MKAKSFLLIIIMMFGGGFLSFTPAQTLMLDMPNGGNSWEADTPRFIVWHSPDWTGNVNIELSTNGGGSYPYSIATNVPSPSTDTPLSYQWTVTNTPSTQCRIRISNAAGGGPTDASNANFTITSNPTITVDIPDGGESWEADEPRIIVWHTHIFTGNVDIELSIDGGGTYPYTVATNIPTPVSHTATSYTWNVFNTPSTQCRIRISNAAGGGPTDVSDADFTITSNPTITVDVPNGGEALGVGWPFPIVWHAHIFTGNVDIELSTDGGVTFPHTIATNVPSPVTATPISHLWTVNNTPSIQCRIRISDALTGTPSDMSDNNFTIGPLPAVSWGDTCMDNDLDEPAEDFLIGSGPGTADQDTYAVGFYNPKGEARLTSVSFQWYDPGSVNLWVYLGRENFCPPCEPLDPGQSPLGVWLGQVGAGDFIGNWEWEKVEVNETCIQIPAKSCFYIVWMMPSGQNRPRIFGDYGHETSHSWIYNAELGEWKCFPGYEYMVEVCLDYQPECVEIHEPDITWSHPYRGEYPCICDNYTVQAVFHNTCDEDRIVGVSFFDGPWGLFTMLPFGLFASCVDEILVPAGGADTVVCDCGFHHHSDTHNWWVRNIVVAWTRDMSLCLEDDVPTYYESRRCRMTVWPDGPWEKEPVRWGLAPITIPVHNDHQDPMRFELRVTDLPENWKADLSWTDRTLPPNAMESLILTVWPDGEVEPDTATVIKVRAFKCNGEWGEVEIEFLPYPKHFYLGPDGRPVQPVHVENIRWSPRYPCHNMPFDVSATVVNDGPNSAYPKISFGLAEWGFFFPVFEEWGDTYKPAVFDTVL
ncbi:MAG: hypothetical protein JSV84_03035, partial [Gemmatimonadota bacterium]